MSNISNKISKFLYLLPVFLYLLPSVVFAEKHRIDIEKPDILPTEAVNFGSLFSGLVSLIIIVAFIAAFIYLIWGGFQWVTSGGDEAAVAAARGRITQALIGLVIVVAAWAIFQLIESFFGITVISGGGFNIPGLGGVSSSAREACLSACDALPAADRATCRNGC